jgi:hypothetical protein
MRNALSPLARIIVALIAVFGLVAIALPADAAIDNAVVVPSPNTSPTHDNYLNSVSCVTASWCVGVGYHDNGNRGQTLIELWDGNSWSIQNSPNTSPTQENQLESVSCVSVSWCVAVGVSDDGNIEQTLIEVWDGTSWSIQASANTSPTENNDLYSVSCLSALSCVAVGEVYNGQWLQTLVQVWDGSTWTIQASDNSSTTETNYLFDVSCLSATSCVAVGAFMRGGWNQPMSQVWDGSSWTMQSTPTFSATEDNFVEGLSCVSASMCVAVGAHSVNGGNYKTMIQLWDGNSWSMQASPSSSPNENNYLWSVSCVSVSSCVAVGQYYSEDVIRTLVQVWDGSTWTIQPSPNPEPLDDNRLQSVSCVSDWQCVAVGWYQPSFAQTLVLSLTGPAPPTTTTTTTADPVAPAFTG